MSIIENNTNEKEKNSSSLHFLDKLKGVIQVPNEEVKVDEEIENNIKFINNDTENKEDNISINTNELNSNSNNDSISQNNKELNNENIFKKNQNEINIANQNQNTHDSDNNEMSEKTENLNDKCNGKEKSDKFDKKDEANNNLNIDNNEEVLTTININNEKEEKNENNKISDDEKSKNDEKNNVLNGEKNEIINKINEEKDNNINEEYLKHKDSKESQKSNKSDKHKSCPSCLNNCMKWRLKAEIKGKRPIPKNFKTKYVFNGTNIFFKKLDFSILNTLHNSLSMAKWNISNNNAPHINTQEILEHIKTESNNKLNNIGINKIPNSPIKDQSNSSVRELLNINYPIDNTKFNYSIIDANLCIKDNLKNLFLLEFDLDQLENMIDDLENKEIIFNKSDNNKDLRAINDECVEREIYFILNGTFHGNKIFKNDLNFSVEYREFIISVQFRLQNYQNKIIEMSKKVKGKKNLFQNMQTNFFGKVLTNINLGIEFSKPQTHEIIQTNFNSIVNSHVELNKILIELTIPNVFINNNKLNISNIFEGINEDTNSISTKKTSISSPKKEEDNNNNNANQNNNFKNKNNYSDNYNIMFNSNMTSPNARTIGINRSIPASPHLNDFQKLIYQQKYSPLINNNLRNNNVNIHNNFPNPAQNSFFSSTPNYPRSPAPGMNPQQMFCSPQPNTYSPLSASLMMMQMPYMGRMMQQPMSINSPFNMSNYSSPYMGNNANIKNNNSGLNSSTQQRKGSDCFQEKNHY